MFRLKINRGKFHLVFKDKNGKVLNSTETFTQKHSAIKNVKATLKAFGGKSIILQDDSLKAGPVVYKVTSTSMKELNVKPKK